MQGIGRDWQPKNLERSRTSVWSVENEEPGHYTRVYGDFIRIPFV